MRIMTDFEIYILNLLIQQVPLNFQNLCFNCNSIIMMFKLLRYSVHYINYIHFKNSKISKILQ